MLTAHLENERKLLETVSIFDRDVAYPLACGENYLDPCVARLDREGDGEAGAGGHRVPRPTAAPSDAAATARSMSGVGSSSLGAFARASPPAPPVGALRRVARTAADVAATAAKWREADEARREAEWRRQRPRRRDVELARRRRERRRALERHRALSRGGARVRGLVRHRPLLRGRRELAAELRPAGEG